MLSNLPMTSVLLVVLRGVLLSFYGARGGEEGKGRKEKEKKNALLCGFPPSPCAVSPLQFSIASTDSGWG